MELRSAYAEGYRDGRAYLEGMSEQQLLTACPQCPGWTIRDVIAHHVHILTVRVIGGWPSDVSADIRAAAIEPNRAVKAAAAKRRDDWIEAGVSAFKEAPFKNVLTAWDETVRAMDEEAAGLVTDFAVHLGDVEEALGSTELRENLCMAAALWRYANAIHIDYLRGLSLDTVSITGHSPPATAGDTASTHTISGSTYELLRAITGRRSRAESDRVLDWGTTPEATRAVFPIYDWLDTDSGAARA